MFLALAGVLLIGLAFRDILQTLFAPQGTGQLSRALMRAVWHLAHALARGRRGRLALAGPLALVAILVDWVVLLVAGWALVLWPHLPGAFVLAGGLDPAAQGGLVDALYLSLVTLATLGYGDIAPRTGWLRIVLPLEALAGFALLTAALSWGLSIYPVLARRRRLAYDVALIRRAEAEAATAVRHLGPEEVARLLGRLAAQLRAVRLDLAQFPISYYFAIGDEQVALPAALPTLVRLAEEARACPAPAARFHAAILRAVIDDLAADLGQHFLRRSPHPLDDLLATYAADHLHRPPR